MATPNQKLAASLTVLRDRQRGGRRVFQAQEFTRVHRERLLKQGFLREALRGWLISSSPNTLDGESTPWYASFWEFCQRYAEVRFGDEWHLSPEQSLLLHAETSAIPRQVILHSPAGTNNLIALLFGLSLYDLKQTRMPPAADLMVRDGLRIFTAAAALIRVPESFYVAHAVEIRVVLASIGDVSELLRRLLENGHSVVAGRLAGALRRAGKEDMASEIVATMKTAGYVVRETDPFQGQSVILPTAASPIVGRLQAMWAAMRQPVLDILPPAPGPPREASAYLRAMDDLYRSDAYHSLSIEGYNVSAELIGRVEAENWDPGRYEQDWQSRDALAARGYWLAFQAVKADISRIVKGENPGRLVRATHRDWYRQLFEPCVSAGLVPAVALAGYRNDGVYLRTSRYVPPRWEVLRDAMPGLFDLLEKEPEPAVRAVLGHWLMGYLHPYPDGNGRLARFVMNAMLAAGGYPWMVIRVEDRAAYLAALDQASLDLNIAPFAQFLADRVPLRV